MAAKVPLNKFRSLYISNNNNSLSAVYGGKIERATIIIQAQATNPTSSEQTVTLKVSSNGAIYPLIENFIIPPFDAAPLVTGRLVIQGVDGSSIFEPDVLMFSASDPDVVLSLGLLETKNTD
jgi:hypothetical protein